MVIATPTHMTDLFTGLLHFGYTGDKARLRALVQALVRMEFLVLEDLRDVER